MGNLDSRPKVKQPYSSGSTVNTFFKICSMQGTMGRQIEIISLCEKNFFKVLNCFFTGLQIKRLGLLANYTYFTISIHILISWCH